MNGVPQFENESQVIIHEAQMTDDASNMIVDDTSNMIVPYGPFSSAAIAGGGSASSAAIAGGGSASSATMDICSVTSIRKSERLQKKDVDAISSIGCSSFANMAISTDEEKYLKECLAALRKKKPAKKSAKIVIQSDDDDNNAWLLPVMPKEIRIIENNIIYFSGYPSTEMRNNFIRASALNSNCGFSLVGPDEFLCHM